MTEVLTSSSEAKDFLEKSTPLCMRFTIHDIRPHHDHDMRLSTRPIWPHMNLDQSMLLASRLSHLYSCMLMMSSTSAAWWPADILCLLYTAPPKKAIDSHVTTSSLSLSVLMVSSGSSIIPPSSLDRGYSQILSYLFYRARIPCIIWTLGQHNRFFRLFYSTSFFNEIS